MQRKKKSLEFLNEHVKAMLCIAYSVKMLSFIINHFCIMRSINVQKNIHIFHDFFIDAFELFEYDFNVYNKLYAYTDSKVSSSYNFNKPIFSQQEIEG